MNSLEEIIQCLAERPAFATLIDYANTTSLRQIEKDAKQIVNKLTDNARRCPHCGTGWLYQTSCPNCGKERSG